MHLFILDLLLYCDCIKVKGAHEDRTCVLRVMPLSSFGIQAPGVFSRAALSFLSTIVHSIFRILYSRSSYPPKGTLEYGQGRGRL